MAARRDRGVAKPAAPPGGRHGPDVRSDHGWRFRKKDGAGDEIRTHDFNLGKVALYP